MNNASQSSSDKYPMRRDKSCDIKDKVFLVFLSFAIKTLCIIILPTTHRHRQSHPLRGIIKRTAQRCFNPLFAELNRLFMDKQFFCGRFLRLGAKQSLQCFKVFLPFRLFERQQRTQHLPGKAFQIRIPDRCQQLKYPQIPKITGITEAVQRLANPGRLLGLRMAKYQLSYKSFRSRGAAADPAATAG